MLLFTRYVVCDSLRLHGLQRVRSLSFTISQSLLKVMSMELVMLSSHLILCRPLLLLPSLFPNIGVFSNESVLWCFLPPFHIRWPMYWVSASALVLPMNIFRWISFRVDGLDLLAVQGTLESSPTPQFKSTNSAVLSFPHSPTLTSIYDYRKNHSFN